MYTTRKPLYQKLEEARKSKVLVYVTGDRPGLETQISHDVVDDFTNHLDSFVDAAGNFPPKISLWLYSRGGAISAGWRIANMLRQFCKELEIIIFSKALSTGTLIALAGDNIIMTKQATLGPIDPSVNSPLNPQRPGAKPEVRVPVSVENVAGYIELAKKEYGIKSEAALVQIFLKLSEHVHPLALGECCRARGQIQMLADKLLSQQNVKMSNAAKKKIVSILCREAGSHDFTISRSEAKRGLGLKVETPSMELYALLKQIHDDISKELELNLRFDAGIHLGTAANKAYCFKRGIIESLTGGSQKFITEGQLSRVQTQQGSGLQTQCTFEGWRNDES